jgi:hypothetical protein
MAILMRRFMGGNDLPNSKPSSSVKSTEVVSSRSSDAHFWDLIMILLSSARSTSLGVIVETLKNVTTVLLLMDCRSLTCSQVLLRRAHLCVLQSKSS